MILLLITRGINPLHQQSESETMAITQSKVLHSYWPNRLIGTYYGIEIVGIIIWWWINRSDAIHLSCTQSEPNLCFQKFRNYPTVSVAEESRTTEIIQVFIFVLTMADTVKFCWVLTITCLFGKIIGAICLYVVFLCRTALSTSMPCVLFMPSPVTTPLAWI